MTSSDSATPVALVLAGGASRRLGRDKRLLDVDGRALLERSVRVVRGLGLPTFVAVNRDDAAVLPFAAAWVHDEAERDGPLAAVLTALDRFELPMLVVAADLPRLELATLEAVLATADDNPRARVVAPRSEDRWDPLCAFYRPEAEAPLRDAWARGERGLQRALERLDPDLRAVVPLAGEALFNLNEPSELREMRGR